MVISMLEAAPKFQKGDRVYWQEDSAIIQAIHIRNISRQKKIFYDIRISNSMVVAYIEEQWLQKIASKKRKLNEDANSQSTSKKRRKRIKQKMIPKENINEPMIPINPSESPLLIEHDFTMSKKYLDDFDNFDPDAFDNFENDLAILPENYQDDFDSVEIYT
jgi:hypothetical protein